MIFLEEHIFIPEYFRSITKPLIEKQSFSYGHELCHQIESSLSDRDFHLFRVLNLTMFKILTKNKHHKKDHLGELRNFSDFPKFFPVNTTSCGFTDVYLPELLETLKYIDQGKKPDIIELKDLFDIQMINYIPVKEKEPYIKMGCIIYVKPGFGDIMTSQDEYNKMELIENVAEYMYRYINENSSEDLASRSYLSVTRLR